MSGWGDGEWSNMAWGTGVDYPYAPIVFLDARGPLSAYTHTGTLARLASTGRNASLRSTGRLVTPMYGTGQNVRNTTRGPLLAYRATGVLED
jgi:hypothetical protein